MGQQIPGLEWDDETKKKRPDIPGLMWDEPVPTPTQKPPEQSTLGKVWTKANEALVPFSPQMHQHMEEFDKQYPIASIPGSLAAEFTESGTSPVGLALMAGVEAAPLLQAAKYAKTAHALKAAGAIGAGAFGVSGAKEVFDASNDPTLDNWQKAGKITKGLIKLELGKIGAGVYGHGTTPAQASGLKKIGESDQPIKWNTPAEPTMGQQKFDFGQQQLDLPIGQHGAPSMDVRVPFDERFQRTPIGITSRPGVPETRPVTPAPIEGPELGPYGITQDHPQLPLGDEGQLDLGLNLWNPEATNLNVRPSSDLRTTPPAPPIEPTSPTSPSPTPVSTEAPIVTTEPRSTSTEPHIVELEGPNKKEEGNRLRAEGYEFHQINKNGNIELIRRAGPAAPAAPLPTVEPPKVGENDTIDYTPDKPFSLPSKYVNDTTIANLAKAGHKFLGRDSQGNGLFDKFIQDTSGASDDQALWENLRKMFGREPTPDEVQSARDREPKIGEQTGQVAQFPDPTHKALMGGMGKLTDKDIRFLDSFDDFGNPLNPADRGIESPSLPQTPEWTIEKERANDRLEVQGAREPELLQSLFEHWTDARARAIDSGDSISANHADEMLQIVRAKQLPSNMNIPGANPDTGAAEPPLTPEERGWTNNAAFPDQFSADRPHEVTGWDQAIPPQSGQQNLPLVGETPPVEPSGDIGKLRARQILGENWGETRQPEQMSMAGELGDDIINQYLKGEDATPPEMTDLSQYGPDDLAPRKGHFAEDLIKRTEGSNNPEELARKLRELFNGGRPPSQTMTWDTGYPENYPQYYSLPEGTYVILNRQSQPVGPFPRQGQAYNWAALGSIPDEVRQAYPPTDPFVPTNPTEDIPPINPNRPTFPNEPIRPPRDPNSQIPDNARLVAGSAGSFEHYLDPYSGEIMVIHPNMTASEGPFRDLGESTQWVMDHLDEIEPRGPGSPRDITDPNGNPRGGLTPVSILDELNNTHNVPRLYEIYRDEPPSRELRSAIINRAEEIIRQEPSEARLLETVDWIQGELDRTSTTDLEHRLLTEMYDHAQTQLNEINQTTGAEYTSLNPQNVSRVQPPSRRNNYLGDEVNDALASASNSSDLFHILRQNRDHPYRQDLIDHLEHQADDLISIASLDGLNNERADIIRRMGRALEPHEHDFMNTVLNMVDQKIADISQQTGRSRKRVIDRPEIETHQAEILKKTTMTSLNRVINRHLESRKDILRSMVGDPVADAARWKLVHKLDGLLALANERGQYIESQAGSSPVTRFEQETGGQQVLPDTDLFSANSMAPLADVPPQTNAAQVLQQGAKEVQRNLPLSRRSARLKIPGFSMAQFLEAIETYKPENWDPGLTHEFADTQVKYYNPQDGPVGISVEDARGRPTTDVQDGTRIVYRAKTGNAPARVIGVAKVGELYDGTGRLGIDTLGADKNAGALYGKATFELLKKGVELDVVRSTGTYSSWSRDMIRGLRDFVDDEAGHSDDWQMWENIKNRTGWGKGGAPETFPEGEKPREPKASLLKELIAASSAATTTGDLSASGRQALPMIGTPEFWKAQGPQIKAAFSQKYFENYNAQLERLPIFQQKLDMNTGKPIKSIAERNGMKLMKQTDHLNDREAAIVPKWVESGGDIPGFSKLYRATLGGYFKGSNRAYMTLLNSIRANRTQKLFDLARDMSYEALSTGEARPGFFKREYTPNEAMALNPYENDIAAREIVDFVNTATGRGPLKMHLLPLRGSEKSAEAIAGKLGYVMFAPRMVASRLRMLNPSTYIMATPFVRKQYMKAALSMGAAWYTMAQMGKLGGGEVSDDMDSADFGKIRIGDLRLDPGSSFQQFLVAFHRLYTGTYTSSATGESHRFGTGFQAQTQGDQGERLFTNKLNPVAKFAWDVMNASEYQPFHVYDRTAQLFVPLVIQDVLELIREDQNRPDGPSLLPLLAPIVMGMGSQVYSKGESVGKFISPEDDWLATGGGLRDLFPEIGGNNPY